MSLPLERIGAKAAYAADMIAKINGPDPAPASVDITWDQLRSAFRSSWTLDDRFDCSEFAKRLAKLGINVQGGGR